MTDLLHVLPEFHLSSYSHIIPSLEKALITSNDLLSLDPLDVAKRAQVPLVEVRRLADDLLERLRDQNARSRTKQKQTLDLVVWSPISTLDDGFDSALGGGFPAGRLSEITGESAAGKTQLLLSLCLAVQLPRPHGLSKSALYISTEAPLQTTRLSQILEHNPTIAAYNTEHAPSLLKIHSTKVRDLETQDHILRYQVPVAIERNNIGLIVLDSVAANFRAEFDRGNGNGNNMRKGAEAFAERSRQLIQLGSHLRHLAQKHNIAIVVANQVLDRFSNPTSVFDYASQHLSQARPQLSDEPDNRPVSAHGGNLNRVADLKASHDRVPRPDHPQIMPVQDPMTLDHQQRFFTGWGDIPQWHSYHAQNPKTPSLGLTWTTQISARVVLLKEPIYKPQDYVLGPGSDIAGWKRTAKVAFADWCGDDNGCEGTGFEIWSGGVRGIGEGKGKSAAEGDGEGVG